MSIIVTKFGGTSLCDASRYENVAKILREDPTRRYVVPSAPGKRHVDDEKVTDLLYRCHQMAVTQGDFSEPFEKVYERFRLIAKGLSLSDTWEKELEIIHKNIPGQETPDYAASRGEYLSGKLLSEYLGWDFLDPAGIIFFDAEGRLDSECTHTLCKVALHQHERAVIPGFYGAMADGRIRTFSRGGSDISGAIIARAAMAELYENWTDVPGFLMADPRIIANPRPIKCLTYRELRELSYMGASVLHEDAVFPVRKAGIPVNIRSTIDPGHPGTQIVPQTMEVDSIITGIAGRKGFHILTVEKALMNAEIGFGRRILQAVEELGMTFEHMPSGIDTLCVVLEGKQLEGKQQALVSRIYELTEPDSVDIKTDVALVATVGRGMVGTPGTSARLLGALSNAGVNVLMMDQGSSELNIIIGVDEKDFETALRVIYTAFVQ